MSGRLVLSRWESLFYNVQLGNKHMSVEIISLTISSKPSHLPVLHNSKSTRSSRLSLSSVSQLEKSFLLCCVPLKPQARLSGCEPSRPEDLVSTTAAGERNQTPAVLVAFCISKGTESERTVGPDGFPFVVQTLNVQSGVVQLNINRLFQQA